MEQNPSQLIPFESPEFGSVRVVLDDAGNPRFVAADVCRALEIGNPSQALSYLDDDEKMTLTTNEGHSGSRGGAQFQAVVTESGLYSLILRSRKPEAKAFKRWVTHEVIPAVRSKGRYALPGAEPARADSAEGLAADKMLRLLAAMSFDSLSRSRRLRAAERDRCHAEIIALATGRAAEDILALPPVPPPPPRGKTRDPECPHVRPVWASATLLAQRLSRALKLDVSPEKVNEYLEELGLAGKNDPGGEWTMRVEVSARKSPEGFVWVYDEKAVWDRLAARCLADGGLRPRPSPFDSVYPFVPRIDPRRLKH
jgi:prophage antirepressor-like protein